MIIGNKGNALENPCRCYDSFWDKVDMSNTKPHWKISNLRILHHRWTPLTTLGISCFYGYGCLVWRELLIWGNQNNSSPHTFSVIFTPFFNLPSLLWYSFLLLWLWHKKLYHECDIMCIRHIWRYVYALELHSFCC